MSNARKTQLSASHSTALTKLFARVLDTSEADVERAFLNLFGKKITYGMVEDMAKEDFTVTRTAFKEADLVPPTALLKQCLKIAGLVTPQVSVCPNCEEFPISEDEIEGGIQTRGVCPLCKEGNLVRQEVVTEHRSWVTGEMVPISKTTDTTAVPGVVLPLTEEGILKYLEQNQPNVALKEVMWDVGISNPRLLLFLREKASQLNPRLRQPTACLRFLCDPSAFDVETMGQLKILCEDAARYEHTTPAPVTPVSPTGGGFRLPASFLQNGYQLNWPNPNVNETKRLLSAAYDTRESAVGILAQSGIKQSHINMEGSSDMRWYHILDYCSKAGFLEKLFGKILADNSIRGFHAQLQTLLQG